MSECESMLNTETGSGRKSVSKTEGKARKKSRVPLTKGFPHCQRIALRWRRRGRKNKNLKRVYIWGMEKYVKNVCNLVKGKAKCACGGNGKN